MFWLPPDHKLRFPLIPTFSPPAFNTVNWSTEMTNESETRIPCSQRTRQLVKAQKRGGESYDELLEKMAKQYDPDEEV